MSAQQGPSIGSPARTIRVFISSTFRDMHGERDELVKRAFPQIRKLCESRGVTFTEVDLRWGVTDEQKAEGNVLSVCLAEIRNCRPYFIGLIGERYGWVPDEISPNLIEHEPWLGACGGHSVTELEILHGVLNDPAMAGHALFYLRDPAYLKHLPKGAHRADFASEGPESAEKLARLKDRIRCSGFPVRESYRDPHELADSVLSDLRDTVNRLFPEGSEPDPLDRESAEHEAFARSRAQVYVARPADFRALDEHAEGTGTALVVLGESGSGKSALLANWALGRREHHSGAVLLMHFVGATPESADVGLILRRLVGELKRRCDLPREIPDRTDRLQAEFGDWLAAAGEKFRIVLVLDALNQIEDRDEALDLAWLPEALPANVRVIVSTLPGRALDEAARRGWRSLYVEPLAPEEREALVVSYLGLYSKALSAARVRQIVESPATANPLYLRGLLDELRLFGVHERLDERLAYYLAAPTPEELYARVLARYEADYETDRPGLVRESMSLLQSARRGLSETELLDLLGHGGVPLPRAQWAPLALAAESMLVNRSGLIRFSHDYVREAVRQKYLPRPRDRRALHRRLADHFESREVGRRRFAWIRTMPALLIFVVYAAIVAGGSRLLAAIDEDSRQSTFVRLLLISPAIVVLVLAAALSLWLVWGLARVIKRVGDRLPARGSSRRRPKDSGHVGEAASGSASLRCVEELPWQLARAGAWWRLYDLLRAPAFFLQAWRADAFSVVASWREIEPGTYGRAGRLMARTRELDGAFRDLFGGRILDAYRRIMANPVRHRALSAPVAQLLIESGHHHQASALVDSLVRYDERHEDSARLGTALVLQADGFRASGYSVATLAAYKRAERFCGPSGDQGLLSRCLEGRAFVALERGAVDDALALIQEAERLARIAGDPAILARDLFSSAKIRRARREPAGALPALEEAGRLLRSIGNRAELARVLEEKRGVLTDLGDLAAARQAHHRATLLRAEMGAPDEPESAISPAGQLDSRLAALRLDEHEYRRAGRKVLLAHALVEQAYHWAILREFPLAAKPVAAEASRRASRQKLNDLLAEFQPVLDATRPPVEQLAGKELWHAPRPAFVRHLAIALVLGACSTYLLLMVAMDVLPALRLGGLNPNAGLHNMGGFIWFVLALGLVLASASARNVHALFARPYFIVTPMGLALRMWRLETESVTLQVLGRLFMPFHRVQHAAVAWSEFRRCRVDRKLWGQSGTLVIETVWGEIKVGRVFHEKPSHIAEEVLRTLRGTAIPGLDASVLESALVFPEIDSSRLAFWSMIFGILSISCLPFLGAIPAVLLGHRALRARRASVGTARGLVTARIGLVLGYLSFLVLLAVFVSRYFVTAR
jgi:hypothetical protein